MSRKTDSSPVPDRVVTSDEERAELFRRAQELLHGDDLEAARELVMEMHGADAADLFARLSESERSAMLGLLAAEQQAHLIEHLDEEPLREVVEMMPRASLARILDLTDYDIAVDVLKILPASESVRTLSGMQTASEVTPLLRHADETAGGIMTPGYVALHKDMTVEEALSFLRVRKPVAEEVYYLYVLDAENRMQGVVALRQLVVSSPDTRIEEIMNTDVASVLPGTDQEEAAQLLQRYRLRALPVVNEDGVLEGVITFDDAIDVITEEATEDMYRMAGLHGEESAFSPIRVSARRRLPWLVVNVATAFVAGALIATFEGTIERAAALAIFMPIVAGVGGNAGIQTITIVVRALTLGEVEPRDASRVLTKELLLGIFRGVLFGLLVGGIAYVWQGAWAWGLVVGIAMMLNMLVAGILGSVIPLTLKAFRQDPASASSVFLTASTDILGFFFLLGLGSLLIDQLT
ncbi:MAG: magnesium transporter [Dehalococcoidia bacterium]